MIKVSVLIPVYGVEPYIERCIRSLFAQTLTEDIEFIFVDDCTPDDSFRILSRLLDEYPERKSQTRIIRHNVNQGLAIARRTAIDAAQGQYLIHCDSDDWVEPDMYASLLAEAERTGARIVHCGYFEELPGKTVTHIPLEETGDREQSLRQMADGSGSESYLWNRLIHRSLCQGRYAEPGTTLLEDMRIVMPMHREAEKVAELRRPLYHYNRSIPASMSSVLSKKAIDSALNVLRHLLDDPDFSPQVKAALTERYKVYAFKYAHSISQYDPDLWRREYRPLILALPLTPLERLTTHLLTKKYDRLNRAVILMYKIVNSLREV